MSLLLPAFGRYPDEGRIIGELVTGYGEIEFSLAHCVSFINGNRDVVFKALFRCRGEEPRIHIADALSRPLLKPGPFKDHFERTIAAVRHCTKIRNLYAHCQWGDDARGLWFVALEEIAKDNAPYDLSELTQHAVTLPHLKSQWEYFLFVEQTIGYLNFEWRFQAGKIIVQPARSKPARSTSAASSTAMSDGDPSEPR